VTVIVDFTAFDGGVVTRCVTGAPDSGLDALADAGFAVEQVATGAGFVCRIDQRPGAALESCASTPPADAHWSYWTAARGGSWTYSPAGAAGTRPTQGGVEGWAFVDGGSATPPSIPPPPLAAPTPRPTTAPTTKPTPPPVTSTTAPPTPAPSVAAVQASQAPSAPPTATASPLPSPSPSESRSEQPSPVATASPGAAGPDRQSTAQPDVRGVPIGTVAGIGLMVGMGGVAVALQRRSRAARDG
jgi:hypothetical protein